jgi:hypothetical protein
VVLIFLCSTTNVSRSASASAIAPAHLLRWPKRCRFQNGVALYSQYCAQCHGFGNKDIRAPSRSLMQAMPFEDVLTTITTVVPNCQSGQIAHAPAPWRWPVKRDRAPATVGGLL